MSMRKFDIASIGLQSIGVQSPIRFLIAFFLLPVLIIIALHWQASVAVSGNESALIYYVAPDGDDAQEGSLDYPWATLNHAAETVGAGDTVYIKGGIYSLTAQIRPQQSGRRDRPITYAAAPGEHVILDAQHIAVPAPSGEPPFAHDQGAFQLEDVAYIRVRDLELVNSHSAGFTVRHSSHIQLYNNTVNTTFSSGIGVWYGDHHQVMGNTIINANLPKLTDYERDDTKQTPHEAISLGGVEYFEVAYNHVHNSAKEGIDIKETSRHGTVHHNHVHHVDRQGLYVDSWFGVLDDVDLYDNVVHHCKGGGFMVSAEGGQQASNIRFHHNLIYDNWGTGILLSRWGQDRLRKHLEIYNNTVYHNGFGPPNPGEDFYWITGGLYLFSTQLDDMAVHHNIFAQNTGFQVGYSDRYFLERESRTLPAFDNTADIDPMIQSILDEKAIRIHDNVIVGDNDTQAPIYAGWAPDDFAHIYGIYGTDGEGGGSESQITMANQPLFTDAYRDNFNLHPEANVDPAIGAFPLDMVLPREPQPSPSSFDTADVKIASPEVQFWWKTSFPPHLDFAENVS